MLAGGSPLSGQGHLSFFAIYFRVCGISRARCETIIMAEILQALIFDGAVSATVLKTTDVVNTAVRLHKLSPLAAAALGRTLTATAFLGLSLKNSSDKLSVTIRGNGPLGSVVTACDAKLHLRGYVDHPDCELPLKAPGKLDVGGGVGREGTLTVIKDLGLKEPFSARSPLVSGEIAEDFAHYFTQSEQTPSAVALGVLMGRTGKCRAAGGVILQPLPFCPEETLKKTEALIPRLSGLSRMFEGKTPEQVAKTLFGDCGLDLLKVRKAAFLCNCSRQRIAGFLRGISPEERKKMFEEDGQIEVICHFCGKHYRFLSPEELLLDPRPAKRSPEDPTCQTST